MAAEKVFISRAGADRALALWIAALARRQGVETILQDEDFGHQNFLIAMDAALSSGALVAALLSPAYLRSDYCLVEAAAALKGDPLNKLERLRVLRVAEAAPLGVLANVAYTDLLAERRHGDATALARKILGALGFPDPDLADAPPPPPEALTDKVQIRHPEIRETRSFAGREDLLAALGERLAAGMAALTNSRQRTDGIYGLGGVGKTTLAREFAWRRRADYEGVWWIKAETEDQILQGLVDLGDHFIPGLAAEEDRAQSAQRCLRFIEAAGWARPFLLVYDNVEDLAAFDRLRPSAGAHVLLTTRRRDLGRVTDGAVDVGVFPAELAAAFLCREALRDAPEAAARLAETLGRLPLALDHAAAYCRENRLVDFDAYAANIAALIARKPEATSSNDYPASVFASFDLALERVIAGRPAEEGRAAEPPCPEAEKLMGVLAFLAPEAVPLDIFGEDFLSPIVLGETVGRLDRVSLLKQEEGEDGALTVSLHRLVQLVMRARLGAAGGEQAAAAVTVLAAAFPEDGYADPRCWPRCAALQPHAEMALAAFPDDAAAPEEMTTLLGKLGAFHHGRAEHAAAEDRLRRALAIDETRLGPEHPSVGRDLNNLALLLQDTNRLSEAGPLYRRALAIDEASFGKEHPSVARDLNNLAQLLQDTGRLSEAEPLMRRALAIDEASLRPEHPRVAIDLNNLASLLQATGRLSEAEPLMRRALAIGEARLGSEHPNVAVQLNNLAQLLKATNRLSEAEPLMRRALAIDEASLGPEHPRVAIDLSNLAQLLKDTGRLSEAEPLMRRALAILEASLGAEHPSVATGLNNLAQLLQETGRLSEAEPLMRRALAIDEASFGSEHPSVGRDLNNLASLLQDTNQLSEAEPLYRRALAIGEASFGSDHPTVATGLNNLAQLLQDIGRLSEAEPLMRRALAILEEGLPDHPNTKTAAKNLERLLKAKEESDGVEAPPPAPERGWFGRLFRRLAG